MDEINITTCTTGTRPFKHKDIVGIYLVECIKDGELYTYPPEDKSTIEYRENITPDRLVAYLLTKAADIAAFYLERTKDVKTIMVYLGDEAGSRPFINGWPKKWEQENYTPRGGVEVKNVEIWKQYNEHMHKLDGVNIGFTNLSSSYSTLLSKQAQKELEKRRNEKSTSCDPSKCDKTTSNRSYPVTS